VDFFIITSLTKDISRIDLIGILIGHLIFGVALTQLLDWTWLKNLMSEEDNTRMLKSYIWKDLLVDGAIFQGYKVTPYYDSMICKLICHGRNRTEAIQRMNRSLDEFVIEGITTTIDLHKTLLKHEKFLNSNFNVTWLDNEKIV